MALLSACWLLIIESILIQDGFLKWHYMKLYMHPLVLFLCQLLLWLHLFFSWLLPPFQAFYYTFLSVSVKFSKLFSRFRRIFLVRCNIESREEIKKSNLELSKSIHNHVSVFSFSFKEQVDSQIKVLLSLQEEQDCFFYECDQDDQLLDAMEGEEDVEEDIDIADPVNDLEFELHTMPTDQEDDGDDDEEDDDVLNSDVENDQSSQVDSDREHPSSLSIASLDSSLQDSIMVENQTHRIDQEDDETDEVYKTYCERMKWYDILSRDRTYGLSVIMNQETTSSLSLWGKTAEKRLKQSIKKDLELVYVAQSCLSWEALQHHYITGRDSLEAFDSIGGLYDAAISREFQNFQILLERFLEDERCQGNRVSSFVQRRLELVSFFHVPRLSGSYNREGPHEGEKEREDKQVLKYTLEKCIQVFYDFVKVDIQKPLTWERLKLSFVKFPPLMELEDPRDFKLFIDLKNSLQKKEQLLKENKKTWFKKRSSNMEEAEIGKDENFMLLRFIVIDLKLVSRVLHMSLVSSSHLKWCQDKLNNIHFNGDKISRTYSPVFFPSS